MSDDSLHDLARDRPLITPELHASNEFYGHATILKRYARIPPGRPLKVVIEHGINLSREVWSEDLASPFACFLCDSERRASLFEAVAPSDKYAVPIGPLLRYLPPDADPEQNSVRRLLIFPAHSTHHVDATYDVGEFLRRCLESDAQVDDIEVCLYWKDVLRGVADEYEARGLRCVTAGHIYDPDFLVRLRNILRRASTVVTNEIGTHLFYAVLEDKPVWYLDQPVSWSAESPEILARDLPQSEDRERGGPALRRLFAEPRAKPSKEQRELVARVTGIDQRRSPDELREILDEAERGYRRRYSVRARGARRARRMAGNMVNRFGRAFADVRVDARRA